ncbi:hypothetical protein [Chryseobacterium sp. MDT2-18]|uniref:hypothetical protein n=1 Tax=Chryseobacterium sp. MDT2-18 TaxID=1259136 RepID=UPI002786F9D4|nr:hypothetical protein [Chryseobacterium sp. MDT2-18]MDQ0477135.1 hypothetical protein [Chryseobacterium sp. MDT2-18]
MYPIEQLEHIIEFQPSPGLSSKPNHYSTAKEHEAEDLILDEASPIRDSSSVTKGTLKVIRTKKTAAMTQLSIEKLFTWRVDLRVHAIIFPITLYHKARAAFR